MPDYVLAWGAQLLSQGVLLFPALHPYICIIPVHTELYGFWPLYDMQGGNAGGNFQDRHTTDMGGGMQSILERNDLDELMAMVRTAATWAS